jgi:hypothetical protein
MALLRTVTRQNRGCMALRTEMPQSGTEVYAVGAPASLALAFSLTRGIVSGYPVIDGRPLLQTDAPVNPGNSGGPITDSDGAALGVVSFKLVSTKVEGIAFAIPTARALTALGLQLGTVTDPRLMTETATVAPVTQEIVQEDKGGPNPDEDDRRDLARRGAAGCRGRSACGPSSRGGRSGGSGKQARE